MKRLAIAPMVLLAALLACDGGEDSNDGAGTDGAAATGLAGDTDTDAGDDTGTDGGEILCDEQPIITYDTFGRGFLSTYCDGCHGPDVINRQGAPDTAVFDTRQRASDLAPRILARSAPDDDSPPTMPPAGGVTPEDRKRLEVWLMCWP